MARRHHSGKAPRNDTQRHDRYVAKLDPISAAANVTARLPSMQVGFAAYMPTEAAIRSKVGALLTAAGKPNYQIARYQGYALEIWRLFKRFAGNSQNDIDDVLCKWRSRGLDAAVLATVRDVIVGIAAPGA